MVGTGGEHASLMSRERTFWKNAVQCPIYAGKIQDWEETLCFSYSNDMSSWIKILCNSKSKKMRSLVECKQMTENAMMLSAEKGWNDAKVILQ